MLVPVARLAGGQRPDRVSNGPASFSGRASPRTRESSGPEFRDFGVQPLESWVKVSPSGRGTGEGTPILLDDESLQSITNNSLVHGAVNVHILWTNPNIQVSLWNKPLPRSSEKSSKVLLG